MGNPYFKFKQFTITQNKCAMKVTTDGCLFGAWGSSLLRHEQSILDIGAGTGLLSLMLAQNNDAAIHGVEIEATCFEQLIDNINSSPWSVRIQPYLKNIIDFDEGIKYDLIISNPPFYEHQLKSDDNSINLARHADQLSLTALFSQVDKLLHEEGRFLLLMPIYRKEEAIRLAKEINLLIDHAVDVFQTTKHDAFRSMICFSKKQKKSTDEKIFIRNEHGAYSKRFTELLEAYYLNTEATR